MRQLKLRAAVPEDSEQIVEWLKQNPLGEYDAAICKYPTLRVIASYAAEGVVCYLPTQKVLVLESLAANPQAGELDKAQAIRDLTKAAELLASAEGIREIWFLDGAGGVGELAEKNGFELLPYKVFRLKL